MTSFGYELIVYRDRWSDTDDNHDKNDKVIIIMVMMNMIKMTNVYVSDDKMKL